MVENRYPIKFTPIAMDDLEEIYRYISEELCAENTAADLLNQIESNIMRISGFPCSGSYLTDEYLCSKGYRRIIVDSYITFYIVDEFTQQAVIMRILHGKRKYEDLL